MKRYLSWIIAAVGFLALSGIAMAQWGGGPGGGWGGMGPGMMRGWGGGGWMGGGGPCRYYEGATATQISPDKAKELAQQYADEYLAGFKVDRVLPFTGRFHTMYSVELKNEAGEVRTLHVNPYGNVMPFGGPWRRS